MKIETLPDTWRCDARRGPVLRLVFGRESVPMRRLWRTGLSVEAGTAPRLPGMVRIYAGERYLASGLICSEEIVGDEHRFHFKRVARSNDRPPRDYAAGDAPAAAPRRLDRIRPAL